MQGHRLSIDWMLLTDLVYRHRQYGQGVYQRNARNGSHVHNKTLSWRGPNAGKKRALEGGAQVYKAPRRERAWHGVAIAQSDKREGREEGGEMGALGSP